MEISARKVQKSMVRRVEIVDRAHACIKKSEYCDMSKKVTFEKRREEVWMCMRQMAILG